MAKLTDEQIQEVIDRCREQSGTRYAGMTYEDGVCEALEWVLGENEPNDIGWPFVED